MTSASEEGLDTAFAQRPPASPHGQSTEPLACVTCRQRKLKCDKVSPACGRCLKVGQECVYPESRRKPNFKKRNVRELEARLVQVEELLKEAAGKASSAISGTNEPSPPQQQQRPPPRQESRHAPQPEFNFNFGVTNDDFQDIHIDFDQDVIEPDDDVGYSVPPLGRSNIGASAPTMADVPIDPGIGEVMRLGLFETLPPFEVMEDLIQIFFQRQHNFIPIIHPSSFLRNFYSAPHMKPPMCLQYAILALASNGHEKYAAYHDVFYQRARQYAEADEMRGYGEHFVTIQHAQAWALIATDEARSMFFTRAAMSSSRCVKLVHMMGLHRLDSPPEEMAPTLAPCTSWVELEERRRTFWGAFCIDSHASVTTGWPTLIEAKEVSTHLPSPEENFNGGEEFTSCTLDEAFSGANYGTFSGTVIICHLFNQILKHVHRSRSNDRHSDVQYGAFWQRHRELDNLLSSAFMFLPEPFRLPRNLQNPSAVHTNLNLHASIICVHHKAIDVIDQQKLPQDLRNMSMTRLKTAADEIVHILRLTSHQNPGYKSPLVALSLYCAASVYVSEASQIISSQVSATPNSSNAATSSSSSTPSNNPTPSSASTPSNNSFSPSANSSTASSSIPYDFTSLSFLLSAMEAIGRGHIITRAFLRQVHLDISEHKLLGPLQAAGIRLPAPDKFDPLLSACSHNIPLLARSRVSRHTSMQPPLPGRLPLAKGAAGGLGGSEPDPMLRPMEPCLGTLTGWREEEEGDGDGASLLATLGARMKSSMLTQNESSRGDGNAATAGNKRRRMESPLPQQQQRQQPRPNAFSILSDINRAAQPQQGAGIPTCMQPLPTEASSHELNNEFSSTSPFTGNRNTGFGSLPWRHGPPPNTATTTSSGDVIACTAAAQFLQQSNSFELPKLTPDASPFGIVTEKEVVDVRSFAAMMQMRLNQKQQQQQQQQQQQGGSGTEPGGAAEQGGGGSERDGTLPKMLRLGGRGMSSLTETAGADRVLKHGSLSQNSNLSGGINIEAFLADSGGTGTDTMNLTGVSVGHGARDGGSERHSATSAAPAMDLDGSPESDPWALLGDDPAEWGVVDVDAMGNG